LGQAIRLFHMAKKPHKRRPTFIREWRKYRGLSQDQVAERVGLSQATVARVERGDIAYTQPVLEAVADALGCAPADLIMRDPSAQGSIWTIWDQIPVQERDQAARVLETFIKRAG
jgi:transcriptional regulator with XRE-family HTH domain